MRGGGKKAPRTFSAARGHERKVRHLSPHKTVRVHRMAHGMVRATVSRVICAETVRARTAHLVHLGRTPRSVQYRTGDGFFLPHMPRQCCTRDALHGRRGVRVSATGCVLGRVRSAADLVVLSQQRLPGSCEGAMVMLWYHVSMVGLFPPQRTLRHEMLRLEIMRAAPPDVARMCASKTW